jgi:alpha-amylase/alpha-mannosidase (GH57 family)
MGINAVCIHGHFYQPPREDPLSGLIPDEVGAEPYRNWNERIHAECYLPNAQLGNFEQISFNIGPTLFHWMESYDQSTYDTIIAQERRTFEKHGVGNGMAQPYHHVILPLANQRDKITQIKWGIADFEHRFGHPPCGMWLPETAVDLETLEVLADYKIKFTILAPWQVELPPGQHTDQPFLIELPGNRQPMIVFLYNRDLSTNVSLISNSTRNADYFLTDKLLPVFAAPNGTHARIALLASDGEVYGHHKLFRDQFLAYLVNNALQQSTLELTYPGLWLLNHQPTQFVKLVEYTSWSCHHGIIRWMGECPCSPGAQWKAPLRWGLDKLAGEIDRQYETHIRPFTSQVWQLRDEYIHVFLEEIDLKTLLSQYIDQSLTKHEVANIGLLLAAQYERQRIFTSCGWFFDNFHRIEPQNNIAYAAQAVWLTEKATQADLKSRALALLKKVKDQRTGLRGDTVFAERYQRTEDFSQETISYFNPSSSFST